MDTKIEHLKLIQNIIDRLATQSGQVKTLAVILVTALIFLHFYFRQIYMAPFVPIAVSAFWILDSYYLWQERLFRVLFDKIALQTESNFSMTVTPLKTRCSALFSETLLIFYGMLFILSLAPIILVGGNC